MKLLIAGTKFKVFHLKEFGEKLTKLGLNYKIINEEETSDRGFPYYFKRFFRYRLKFNKILNEYQPDAVFVDSAHFFGFFPPNLKIPLFMHLRGHIWLEMKWARETLIKLPHKRFIVWMINRIAEKSIIQSITIVPICKYLAQVSKERYPQKTVEVLYQGISPSLWYQTEKMDLKHPCVGLLQDANIWGKAREMFNLTKVLDAMPNVTFYWVGDGPYRDKVLPTLSKYKNFKWLGYLKYPEEIRKYLSSIDVYALVSGIDMAPLSLLEAQLMELPVVATKVGGIPELMEDGKTGYLVKKGDASDLIEKLSIFLNDRNKAQQMGKAGRKFVEKNFNWDIIAKRFMVILQNGLKNYNYTKKVN